MLSFRIAWRFLRSSPVQSLLIAGGIAVGIAAQIFVGSLIVSLQSSLVDQTIGSSPHVTIQAPDEGDPIAYTDAVRDVIASDSRVRRGSLARVRTIPALYSDGSESAPLNLVGGELGEIDGIYRVSERITSGQPSLRQDHIMIGTEFAERFGVTPGDTIALAFQGGKRTTFTVAGVFDLGNAEVNERQAFVAGSVPQDVVGWADDEYSSIQVQMTEPFRSAEVAADWRRRLTGADVIDWQSQNADLLTALQSQSSSSYLIQAFVLIAVALGIASTLAINAVQKTRQIGILKAMGMGNGPSGRIFLFEALIIGAAGSVAGVVLGALFIWGFSFAPVPFSITMDPAFVALSMTIGILVALASSIVPARNTSRLDPIEVIQGG